MTHDFDYGLHLGNSKNPIYFLDEDDDIQISNNKINIESYMDTTLTLCLYNHNDNNDINDENYVNLYTIATPYKHVRFKKRILRNILLTLKEKYPLKPIQSTITMNIHTIPYTISFGFMDCSQYPKEKSYFFTLFKTDHEPFSEENIIITHKKNETQLMSYGIETSHNAIKDNHLFKMIFQHLLTYYNNPVLSEHEKIKIAKNFKNNPIDNYCKPLQTFLLQWIDIDETISETREFLQNISL